MLRTAQVNRLNCHVIKVAFILMLLEFSLMNVQSQYNCTAESILLADGDTRPKYLEISIGGSANITCQTLDGENSSTIWFLEKNYRTNITQPNEQIVIINNTTALLRIENATENSFEYQCMSGEYAIQSTKVFVGSAPEPIKNFSCRVYDFQNMTCSFTKPENMLSTQYEVFYSKNQSHYTKACNLTERGEKFYCILDATGTYEILSTPCYYFNITARNKLGSQSKIETIDHYNSVIPAKPNISIRNATVDSVVLVWKNLKPRYYKETNLTLKYKFCLKPKDLEDFCFIECLECFKSYDCEKLIKNLKYAGYEYGLNVSVKVNSTTDDMWSKTFNTTFKTMPKSPSHPPTAITGSFYIDPTLNLRLYWKQIEVYNYSGPGFHYIIYEMNTQGNLINTYTTNESMLNLGNNYITHERIFRIKSSNDIGVSKDYSVIRVPGSISYKRNYEPTNLSKVYNKKTYVLSWKPPKRLDELINYTVFWCSAKLEILSQCKGSINFTQIEKNRRNFTTEPQDRTLNLAVSANYENYSTGMFWALCTANENDDLIELMPEINVVTANSIELKWSLGRICSSIVKGYKLTYCQIEHNATISSNGCLNSTTITLAATREESSDELKHYKIVNLVPYSKYRINMIMYSKHKVGPSNEGLIGETKEAAPSPPRNLKVLKTTNESAILSWLPPTTLNGKIRNYTIYIRKSGSGNNTVVRYLEAKIVYKSNERINYTVESLNSYTEYIVSVSARTVEDSMPCNETVLKTMIGRPTTPRNVSVSDDKLDKNYGLIEWADPERPSGRLEFYAIAMTVRIEQTTTVKTTLINGHRCRFRFPDYQRPNYIVTLKVRAVNFANKSEIDHEKFPIKNNKVDYTLPNKDETFECEGTLPLQQHPIYKHYLIDGNDVQNNANEFIFFSSSWEDAKHNYSFNNWDINFIIYYVAVTILMIFFISFATFSIIKKYKKMKNIQAVLPPGLADQLSTAYNIEQKNKSAGSKNYFIINKENSRLFVAAKRQNSVNAMESEIFSTEDIKESSNETLDYVEYKEDNSNGSSYDEQFSSQSTDSFDIKDLSSCSYTKTLNQNECTVEDKTLIATLPNKLLTNVTEQINFETPTMPQPTQASNGYVTFDPIKPNIEIGYIAADSFVQNTPTTCDTTLKNHSIQIQENSEIDTNKGNSSYINNNMYVTQQQLAELGRISVPK